MTQITPAPMMMQHTDSVSAAETRRLRASDAALRSLRDSLNNAPVSTQPVTSDATLATMQATIHFAFDESVLTDSAKAILDEKVEVFRANPAMAIVIVGHTDLFGTDAYNMALGNRRANAAAAYIVARGIEASRVIIESKGESQPITEVATTARLRFPGNAGLAREFDRVPLRRRPALRADAVLATHDHEVGRGVARRALSLHDRLHLCLQSVSHEPRRHDNRRHRPQGAERTGAMLPDLETNDLAIMNRRRVVLHRVK